MFLLYGADILYSQIFSSNGRSISVPSQFLSLIVNILVTKGDALWHSSVLLDVRCVPFIRPWNVPRTQASVSLCRKWLMKPPISCLLVVGVITSVFVQNEYIAQRSNVPNLDTRLRKAFWITLLQVWNSSDSLRKCWRCRVRLP